MQICFILQNSLTMLQKSSLSDLSYFDIAKTSIQSFIKFMHQSFHHQTIIHLFTTSSTHPISSFQQTDQHLLYQLKNLQCTAPTFPSQVIQSALFHVGKFRCLNQTQTLFGYRQGTVYEPCIMFYVTDRMNQRQIRKIYQKYQKKKLQIRAEYQINVIKICAQDKNSIFVADKFKKQVENQKETIMINEIMKKVNGELIHVYKMDTIVNVIKKKVENYKPSLTMKIQPKQYHVKNQKITQVTFASPYNQHKYLKKLQQLINTTKSFKHFPSCTPQFSMSVFPTKRRFQIPLPLQLIAKQLSPTFQFRTSQPPHNIIIDKFQELKFQIDFTKQYQGKDDQILKGYFFNMYDFMLYQYNDYFRYKIDNCKELNKLGRDIINIMENSMIKMVSNGNRLEEKKFPVFYQISSNNTQTQKSSKNTQKLLQSPPQQYLIGYLRFSYLPSQKTIPQPSFQLYISFANFPQLFSIFRSIKQRSFSIQPLFQSYLSNLPIFYHRFLKLYLSNIGININNNIDQMFQNINNKPIGILNMKFYQNRLNEKRKIAGIWKINKDKHQSNQAECCAVYSRKFAQFEKNRSKFYDITNNNYQKQQIQLFKPQSHPFISQQLYNFFKLSIFQLSKIKSTFSINDYFTIPYKQSTPLKHQYQKYNIRRQDDQINQIVGDILGNPFKKYNKKIKLNDLNDQTESVWIDQKEIGQMKQLIQKQDQIIGNIKKNQNNERKNQQQQGIKNDLKKDSLYEQLEYNKHVIQEEITKNPEIILQINPEIFDNTPNDLIQIEQSNYSSSTINKDEQQITQLNKDEQNKNITKSLTQQKLKHQNQQNQSQLLNQIVNKNQANNSNKIEQPQLIKDINKKFKMQKKVSFSVPAKLLQLQLYVKNKNIIEEVINEKNK